MSLKSEGMTTRAAELFMRAGLLLLILALSSPGTRALAQAAACSKIGAPGTFGDLTGSSFRDASGLEVSLCVPIAFRNITATSSLRLPPFLGGPKNTLFSPQRRRESWRRAVRAITEQPGTRCSTLSGAAEALARMGVCRQDIRTIVDTMDNGLRSLSVTQRRSDRPSQRLLAALQRASQQLHGSPSSAAFSEAALALMSSNPRFDLGRLIIGALLDNMLATDLAERRATALNAWARSQEGGGEQLDPELTSAITDVVQEIMRARSAASSLVSEVSRQRGEIFGGTTPLGEALARIGGFRWVLASPTSYGVLGDLLRTRQLVQDASTTATLTALISSNSSGTSDPALWDGMDKYGQYRTFSLLLRATSTPEETVLGFLSPGLRVHDWSERYSSEERAARARLEDCGPIVVPSSASSCEPGSVAVQQPLLPSRADRSLQSEDIGTVSEVEGQYLVCQSSPNAAPKVGMTVTVLHGSENVGAGRILNVRPGAVDIELDETHGSGAAIGDRVMAKTNL